MVLGINELLALGVVGTKVAPIVVESKSAEPEPSTSTAEASTSSTAKADTTTTEPTKSESKAPAKNADSKTDPVSNAYQVQLTDPQDRRQRFQNLPAGLAKFSSSIWDEALRALVKDSPFMVDAIKDARFEIEYQFVLRFRELMQSASNTPRFVDGVKKFSGQVSELLDLVFGKLVGVAQDHNMQIE